MKKSKSDTKINTQEILNDLNSKNFEDIDLNEVDKKTNKFKKKYKDILPEESKDDLDTEK